MGQLIERNEAIGKGQAWQDVTASRVMGTLYTNTTGRAIVALFQGFGSIEGSTVFLVINGVGIVGRAIISASSSATIGVSGLIPHGAQYYYQQSGCDTLVIQELR